VSLSLGLAGLGGAMAQEVIPGGISTNADGSYVTSTAGVNPTANGGGGTIIYGDITTGPGHTVIGSPPVVQTNPEPVAAPVTEPAPVEAAPVDTAAPADTAVATASDQDADNIADELEWDRGLDPSNPDTDGDGVADGDELNIYGTEPTAADTDGDGVTDGAELFANHTDPLVWDDSSTEQTASVAQEAVDDSQQFEASAPVAPAPSMRPLAQGTTEVMTATDGDAAALGTGSASASPGTVTRDGGSGMALLGPDGTYNVTENAPSNVTISGDTDVIAPPAEAAPVAAADSNVPSYTPTCATYVSWYDAQVAYEAAGMTAADPAMVSALDPDYDGIACEEGMQ
jgi:hypothetical protein